MGFRFAKPEGEQGKAWPAIVVGLFVAFGGILFGYDTGTISGITAMDFWLHHYADKENNYQLTSAQNSLIVSILSAGTFFGALAAAPFADILGRRLGLMSAAGIVFNLGVILQTASTSRPLFIAGRFFAGLGVGLVSAMIPMYQSETAPKWVRGTIVGTYQLAITLGLFIAAIVNNGTKNRNDTGSYRIPVAIQFAWSTILVVGLIFLPETPRFLIKQGRPDKAAQSLARLRRLDVDNPALQAELAEIEGNFLHEQNVKAGYAECFRGTIGKRLLTGCLLQSLQQLTGVNFIFYYGTQYFKNAHFHNPFVIQVITNCVNVISTFPGLYMVEKMGRRNLLLFGAIGMCVCQFIVASVGTASPAGEVAPQRAAIAFVCIYIFFFACSWGPVAWVVTGELFPLKVRAKCLSMTTASNWLLNWAIAYSTPYMVDSDKGNLQSKVFFIWGSFCFVCIAFVYFMIYETKGLSLEEVDELYALVNKAWLSKKFRPMVRFAEVQKDMGTAEGRHLSLAEIAALQERRRSSAVPGAGVAGEKPAVPHGEPLEEEPSAELNGANEPGIGEKQV